MFSWYTSLPVAWISSTGDEDAATVASEVTVDGVADNSDTAPNTQRVVRQEEEVGMAEVPMPIAGCSRDQDFH